jgi:hypothetical protein
MHFPLGDAKNDLAGRLQGLTYRDCRRPCSCSPVLVKMCAYGVLIDRQHSARWVTESAALKPQCLWLHSGLSSGETSAR